MEQALQVDIDVRRYAIWEDSRPSDADDDAGRRTKCVTHNLVRRSNTLRKPTSIVAWHRALESNGGDVIKGQKVVGSRWILTYKGEEYGICLETESRVFAKEFNKFRL